MSLVEGFGDEVVLCLVAVVLVVVVGLAWWSTGVRPLFNSNNSVWLVQMQTWPQNRILQMFHIDEAAAEHLENDPNTRTVRVETNGEGELETLVPEESTASESSAGEGEGVSAAAEAEADGTREAPSADGEEGAASPPPPADTNIRLKFLDDTQKMVCTWLEGSVGEFKRQHFGTEVEEGKVIRLIYKGQLLRDDSRSLASYGLHDNCIVHAHVSNTPYESPSVGARQRAPAGRAAGSRPVGGSPAGPPGQRYEPPAEAGEEGGLQLGRWMNTVFGLIFGAVWVFYTRNPQYFDFASLFSLILCSVIFMTFLAVNRLLEQRERAHFAAPPPPAAN